MLSFRSLPKIELHLHLDCSLSYAVASRLNPGLTQERFEESFIAPPRCASLADYLTRATAGIQLMQSEEAMQMVTDDLFDQLAEDRVIYAEIRLAPLLHTEKGLAPEAVVERVERAVEVAEARTGITARLILCTLRHFTETQGLRTAGLLELFRGSRVVGLDLAADEAGFPIEAHVKAFQLAQKGGFFRTAHAGEARGPESVRETLAAFRPTRLGHGVRSIEDPELVEALARNRIHLEVCPSSNVQTRACDSLAVHPLDRLVRAGVSIGLNTDTRTITNVTLTEEYGRIQAAFGWEPSRFLQCNLDALDAAFLDEQHRASLRARLLDGWRNVTGPGCT